MIDQEPRLKIAIQKSGRLADESVNLLKNCGLSFDVSNQKLLSPVRNFPIDILYLRDDDIPRMVERGVSDLGIVGNNVFDEQGDVIDPLLPLGFGRCKLTVGVPTQSEYQSLEDLRNKTIATSYVNLTGTFFTSIGVPVLLEKLDGSVEIAPSIGAADAISDLTSTGSTMTLNDLRPIADIFDVQSFLIANRRIDEFGKQKIIDRLVMRIKAVLTAKDYKYVAMNAPQSAIEQIRNIMPGLKSPTVTPLAEAGWFSIQSVLPENRYWELLEELQKAGAEGIIVLPIEKMVL